MVGNCDYVLTEVSRPDVREVRSTMSGNVLRIGDTEVRPEEALELMVKTSKCTALSRPKSFKKFARRKQTAEEAAAAEDKMDEDGAEESTIFAQLRMRSEYYLEEDKPGSVKDEDAMNKDVDENDAQAQREKRLVKVEKEELVRGYKYGASFVPAPDDEFPKLPVRKGMDICGFFPRERFRREMAMGEVYYVWADTTSPMQQVALSSIVKAMTESRVLAITRWVKSDKGEPKMGVLWPTVFDEIDCFLWVQMPFADDVRNFTFASLEKLINKKGEVVEEHPYLRRTSNWTPWRSLSTPWTSWTPGRRMRMGEFTSVPLRTLTDACLLETACLGLTRRYRITRRSTARSRRSSMQRS